MHGLRGSAVCEHGQSTQRCTVCCRPPIAPPPSKVAELGGHLRLDTLTADCSRHVDRVIVCPATDQTKSISEACMLIGAYLILVSRLPLEAVVEAFQRLEDPFILYADYANSINIFSCWQALDQSKCLGWFVVPRSEIAPALDVEAFEHYASGANGSVHMAVPGKMIFFPSSEVLPNDQEWIDIKCSDGETVRNFSPRYCKALPARQGCQ
jgi:hypothetical protein